MFMCSCEYLKNNHSLYLTLIIYHDFRGFLIFEYPNVTNSYLNKKNIQPA